MKTKDKKIPMTVSLSLKTTLALEQIIQTEGLVRSRLIEDLVQDYISSWFKKNQQDKDTF